mmetsp:Transcript_34996/g.77859  ORF Transcript_34996/g.77859 Transcript_34996/m.77859 type:complete len:861 (-) Transcript_34996:442-3024(-)
MTIRLRDLIRAVRACKTAAEEREAIAKESAALREAFRDQDAAEYRHRNVAKLMYIHMLGYPTHFGQMETLKLIAGNGFPEKRIGYLGLMLLLDERQEVLMLVTNSLKMDLNHKNQYIAGLALAALGNICSAEMARDLAPDIEKLLESNNPYIRKKAALCATRIVKKVPELTESFVDRTADLLNDRYHGVQLAGVTLMLQICEQDSDAVEKYRRHVPALCKILRGLMTTGTSPEHEISGINDPFLQVKILRLLRFLGHGNAEASDQMSDILAQVASNIDGSRNAGNAILYECVQTIMGIEAIGGLRVLAVNILGKFLANKDNNIRYVALNTLSKVVGVDTQAVQRHRATIVECVKDADVSIRRRALELVYSLVNENNIRTLTRELLDYLAVSDAEFKPDLTAKICTLIQRFAPDKRWHIDQLLQVMTQAGAFVKEEVCRTLVVLITNTPELHGYAVRSMYRNLHAYQDVCERSLAITALWCIGEFGEMLIPGAGGPLLENEPALNVGDFDIAVLVESLTRKTKDVIVREYALAAAMKLTARLPNQVARLKALVQRYGTSSQLEVQARSAEFSRMFLHERIRPQLLERMPALEEGEGAMSQPSGAAPAAGSAATSAGGAAPAAAPQASGGDLLGLDALDGSGAAPPKAAVDALEDLLGGSKAPAAAAPAQAAAPKASAAAPAAAVAAQGAADLLDLLSGSPARPPAASAAPPAAAPAPVDPLASALQQPAPAAAPAGLAPQFAPIVAWQNAAAGLSINFAFTKHAGNESLTDILATYTNTGASAVSDFNLQAAVPKFMQLRLEPATSTVLSPGAAPVQQRLYVVNTMQGQKALIMRLRISYTTADGQAVVEQAEVSNFPQGL